MLRVPTSRAILRRSHRVVDVRLAAKTLSVSPSCGSVIRTQTNELATACRRRFDDAKAASRTLAVVQNRNGSHGDTSNNNNANLFLSWTAAGAAALLSTTFLRRDDDATQSERVASPPKAKSRFDDGSGYAWPDMYEEVDHMLNAANLIYCFSALRDLCWRRQRERNDDAATFEGEARFMRPGVDADTQLFAKPLGVGEVGTWVVRNMEAIATYEKFYEDNRERLELAAALAGLPDRCVVYIEDSEGDETEVVYGLVLDHKKKRIIVTFRGTSAPADVRTDVRLTQRKVVLPNSTETVDLHRGFYEYLFNKDKYEERFQAEKINKYTAIMNKLVPLTKKYPGYKVYVTGHSLGGALATLFSLSAARSDDLPKPVTCVSVASPYVGGKAWRSQYADAEKRGLLRHLRVANSLDIIAHGPPFDLSFDLYKHVGLNLRLLREIPVLRGRPSHTFQYPTGGLVDEAHHAFVNNCLGNFAWFAALKMHSCTEYKRRLDGSKEELEKTYLNDMYESALGD